jgi:chromosome segregation ATPase
LFTNFDHLQAELQHCYNVIHQLRIENSQKWRVEERDDWKALVNSIQKDRRRLEEDNDDFEARIRKANDKIIEHEAQVECLQQQLDPAQIEKAAANGQDAQSTVHLTAVMKKLEETRDSERQVSFRFLLVESNSCDVFLFVADEIFHGSRPKAKHPTRIRK